MRQLIDITCQTYAADVTPTFTHESVRSIAMSHEELAFLPFDRDVAREIGTLSVSINSSSANERVYGHV